MDVTPFLAPFDKCEEKVKNCTKIYKRKGVISQMTHSQIVSINRFISKLCNPNVDSEGTVFFVDEIDPKKVADYLYENKTNLELPIEIIFQYVCLSLRRRIRELHKICKSREDDEYYICYDRNLKKFSKKDIARYHKEMDGKYIERQEYYKWKR